MHPIGQITQLLDSIRGGNETAADELFSLTCGELRKLAEAAMRRQDKDHILQPTALVNEAVARILNSNALCKTENRLMFYALSARAMRSVLVDYARRRAAGRRSSRSPIPLSAIADFVERFEAETQVDLLILNETLETLRANNQRQHDVVVMHFFGGFRFKEIAEQLNVSISTVEKDWAFTRAWLRKKLS